MLTPFQEDKNHALDMERGSKWLREAIEAGATSHTNFRWVNRVVGGTWLPGDEPREYRTKGYQRAIRSAASKEAALARRVDRDPCPVCATRGDLGCAHRRMA